jgi:aryl-alcohol dehydrogenase-like predicted oxidoreductase
MRWPALPEYPIDDVFPADHIRRSTEESLTNLGLESVDLQQLHVWTDAWALDDRWQRAVDDLKRERLIRGFGISLNRWEPDSAFNAIATGLIDSVQVVYNIFDQNPEDELFPRCHEQNIAVIARVPFDEGSLAGAIKRGMRWPEGDWRNLYFTRDRINDTLDHVDRLVPDLPRGSSLAEAALRFILAHPDVSTVIPGMRRIRHVEENIAVSSQPALTDAEMAKLRPHRWIRSFVVA